MNLRLLQLGDSALPMGGYSHSWGLEAAVDRGLVRDAPGLEQLDAAPGCDHSLGPCEGVVVAATCRAAAEEDWSEVQRANEVAPGRFDAADAAARQPRHGGAAAGPRGILAVGGGRRGADCESGRRGCSESDWHHAVVFGALAARLRRPSRPRRWSCYLHQAALGVIAAGVQAVPIGHTHGQQVLARLHDDLQRLAEDLADARSGQRRQLLSRL